MPECFELLFDKGYIQLIMVGTNRYLKCYINQRGIAVFILNVEKGNCLNSVGRYVRWVFV